VHDETSIAAIAAEEWVLMNRKHGVSLFVIILGFILVLGSVTLVVNLDDYTLESTMVIPEPERRGILGAIPHAPIVIDGDTNFNSTAQVEGWYGNGSSEAPFIIEGLEIDFYGDFSPGISISNTRVHFIVRTCVLNGMSFSFGYGISLYNVTNGELIENKCTGSECGIFVELSNSSTITGNNCSSTIYGIKLSYSYSNALSNNTCSGNGYGICLYVSDFNTITDNTCSENSAGIELLYANSDILSNNTCTGNTYGIDLEITNSNTMSDNTLTSNDKGISLIFSDSDNMFNNTFNSNIYGIYLDSSHLDNTQWNVFVDSQCLNAEVDNVFDHNYWSDYTGIDANGDGFGDTPYTFGINSDPHPLMYYPFLHWIEPPTDKTVEFEYLFHYDLSILYYGPMTCSISDTIHFSIDNDGVVESNCILPISDYILHVTVTNIYGISIEASFHVKVVFDADNPPSWLTIPTDQSILYGRAFDYQIMVIDPSGIDHWEFNDTTHFTLSTSFYYDGSTARLSNKSILEPGFYGLNISVYDLYDNRLSTAISIIVEADLTAPNWVIFPIDHIVEYGESLTVQLAAWDESGIHLWWMNDTVHFAIDEYGTLRNTTHLDVGTYRLEVRAYDLYNNYISASMTVTVTEVPAVTTTTTTTTTTGLSSTPPVGIDPVMTFALGTGLGGAAVIIIVIVLLRRKS
jgi:parallel beta-helix repeat protein